MDDATLSNMPRIPSPEVLRELLADENRDIIQRANELLAAFERAPAAVTDDDTSGKVADFVRQFDAALKLAETRRTSAKQPTLDAGKAIDGFFRPWQDKLTTARAALKKRIEAYLLAKAAEERRRREQEAARAEQERKDKEAAALAAIDTAPAGEAEKALDAAADAQFFATQAAIATEAKPAEMARTRGEYGSVSTLATRWVGEVVDRATLDLEALRDHLPADALEKAVRSFVRAGGRELKGAKIYESSSAVIR